MNAKICIESLFSIKLKPHIDINTELKKMRKMILKRIFKLIKNAFFVKTMENMRKHIRVI